MEAWELERLRKEVRELKDAFQALADGLTGLTKHAPLEKASSGDVAKTAKDGKPEVFKAAADFKGSDFLRRPMSIGQLDAAQKTRAER